MSDQSLESFADVEEGVLDEVTVEGPRWSQTGGLSGTLWRVPLDLHCPFCDGAPWLEYRRHAVFCDDCGQVFEPVERGDAESLVDCPWCSGPLSDDGVRIWCRRGDEAGHAPTSRIRGRPEPYQPCTDCGRPRDLAGNGRMCRRCVLTSYVETRSDELASRWLMDCPDERWLELVGFPRNAEMWGGAEPFPDDLPEAVPSSVQRRIDLPVHRFDPERLAWQEYYAVELRGSDQPGQHLLPGVPDSPLFGQFMLYRLADASGLVYEAALPAGAVADPESEVRSPPAPFSRKVPYPDRVIGTRYAHPAYASAFQRSGRQMLVNEINRPGRPEGTTTYSRDQWFAKHGEALEALRRENIRPTNELLADRIGVRESTFYKYQREYGRPPRD